MVTGINPQSRVGKLVMRIIWEFNCVWFNNGEGFLTYLVSHPHFDFGV